MTNPSIECIAFEGQRRIASGPLCEVARQTKEVVDARPLSLILVLDTSTSAPIELDFRGSVEQMLERLAASYAASCAAPTPAAETARCGPGRPRLGVVAREVTLLPRHWEWLASQPGGASVALRKLVEQARRLNLTGDRRYAAQEATFRFMSAMAGDFDGYEEACRALFAGKQPSFETLTAAWPHDVREHLHTLAANAFVAASDEEAQSA